MGISDSFPKMKVYAGLSLSKQDVERELPGAEFSGPIQRYDLLRDIDAKYQVALIVDGKFFQSVAVSPNEIMDAIRCGVRVYGSSSMGALRAVELAAFGMVGFGKIFEYIKNTPIFRDDFVGQAFFESEGVSELISHSYMDLHFAIERARQAGQCNAEQSEILLSLYSKIYFPQRSKGSLIAEIKRAYSERPDLLALTNAVFSEGHSQKREDALGLLRLVKEDLAHTRRINERLWEFQRISRNDQL
jgi:hypothetical protein